MSAARGPADAAPGYRATLAHRPFALLWASQLISQSGDFVFEVAILWLVLQATGSVFAVGLIVTATLVPVVVLGPGLGVYVDRWNRRRILLATNLTEAALVAGLSGLVLAHVTPLPALIAIVLGLACGAQFVRITSSALVPQTVPSTQLGPANGLMSFSGSFNQVIGLSIGGVVVALLGVAVPIEYDALTFVLAALLVALIPSAAAAAPPRPDGAAPSFRAEFSEGFAYLRGQRFLVEVIALGMILNFFGNAQGALLAPYADLTLRGNSVTYGLLGAAIAFGALAGALLVGRVDTRRSAGRFLFGGGLVLGGLIVALGLTRSVPLALVESLALGVFLSLTNVPLLTLIQAKVPMRLMGRVLSVLMSLILIAAPLGSFFAGSLAADTSVSTVFVVSGAVVVGVVGVGAVALPGLRDVTY